MLVTERCRDMKKEAQKQQPSNLFEGMVSVRAVLEAAENGFNDRKILTICYAKENLKRREKEYRFLCARGKALGFPVILCDAAEIEKTALGTTHGGVLAKCSERTLPRLETVEKNGFYMMLEGIEDPYNFGYALRSLYAAGVDGVILPPRNWMSAAGVVCRASAGASEKLPLYLCDTADSLSLFHKNGYRIYAADTENAVSVYDASLARPLYLIVGGEKRGISAKTMQQADEIIRLDYGRPDQFALSAASAASVLAFEVYRQNRGK